MRHKAPLIAAGLFLLLLIGAAGGVYAYDSRHKDVIADGVSVQGVAVGGLTAEQARQKLEAELLTPLSKPVVVRYRGRRFKLTSKQAKIGVDVGTSVENALERSRAGNPLTRTVRQLRGETLDAELPVTVSYSKAAIKRLVRRVEKSINTAPRDAKVDIGPGGVNPVASVNGRRVLRARLARDVERRLTAWSGSRSVRVRTKSVSPETTTAELAKKYPTILIVNRGGFKLTLYKELKLVKTYGIAVGQAGLETPAGLYSIQNKAENPAWHVPDSDWAGELRGKVIPGGVPENPIKARWMGIYDGVGVHGTAAENSIGTAASHGCIRMRVAEVIELYERVNVGAPIYIA